MTLHAVSPRTTNLKRKRSDAAVPSMCQAMLARRRPRILHANHGRGTTGLEGAGRAPRLATLGTNAVAPAQITIAASPWRTAAVRRRRWSILTTPAPAFEIVWRGARYLISSGLHSPSRPQRASPRPSSEPRPAQSLTGREICLRASAQRPCRSLGSRCFQPRRTRRYATTYRPACLQS
jgi:hypothetical protein